MYERVNRIFDISVEKQSAWMARYSRTCCLKRRNLEGVPSYTSGVRTPPRSSGLVGLVVVVAAFGIWLIRVISSLLQITAVRVRFAVPPTGQVQISIFFSGSGRNQDVVQVHAELV